MKTDLSAYCLAFRARCVVHLLRDLHKVDATHQIHAATVDLQDLCTRDGCRIRELDLTVNAAYMHMEKYNAYIYIFTSNIFICK